MALSHLSVLQTRMTDSGDCLVELLVHPRTQCPLKE
jgi:hypothetical protein